MTLFFFVTPFLLAPLLLGLSLAIQQKAATGTWEFSLKGPYKMAVKTLFFGPRRLSPIALCWLEWTLIAALFFVFPLFPNSPFPDHILMATTLTIFLKTTPLLKQTQPWPPKNLAPHWAMVMFLILTTHLSLWATYKIPRLSLMASAQSAPLLGPIPQWGLFTNPIGAFAFLFLILLNEKKMIQKELLLPPSAFLEQGIDVLKTCALSLAYTWFFLGGPHMPWPFEVFVPTVFLVFKVLCVFILVSFLQEAFMPLLDKTTPHTLALWALTSGTFSLMALLWT